MSDFIVNWLIEKRVIYVKPIGKLDFKTHMALVRAAIRHLEQGGGFVHAYYDVTGLTAISFALKEVMAHPDMKKYFSQAQWTLFVGPRNNPYYEFVAAVAMQKKGGKMRWFEIRQEAFDFLKEVSPELTETLDSLLETE